MTDLPSLLSSTSAIAPAMLGGSGGAGTAGGGASFGLTLDALLDAPPAITDRAALPGEGQGAAAGGKDLPEASRAGDDPADAAWPSVPFSVQLSATPPPVAAPASDRIAPDRTPPPRAPAARFEAPPPTIAVPATIARTEPGTAGASASATPSRAFAEVPSARVDLPDVPRAPARGARLHTAAPVTRDARPLAIADTVPGRSREAPPPADAPGPACEDAATPLSVQAQAMPPAVTLPTIDAHRADVPVARDAVVPDIAAAPPPQAAVTRPAPTPGPARIESAPSAAEPSPPGASRAEAIPGAPVRGDRTPARAFADRRDTARPVAAAMSLAWTDGAQAARPISEATQPEPIQPEPIQPEPIQPEPIQPEPIQPEPILPSAGKPVAGVPVAQSDTARPVAADTAEADVALTLPAAAAVDVPVARAFATPPATAAFRSIAARPASRQGADAPILAGIARSAVSPSVAIRPADPPADRPDDRPNDRPIAARATPALPGAARLTPAPLLAGQPATAAPDMPSPSDRWPALADQPAATPAMPRPATVAPIQTASSEDHAALAADAAQPRLAPAARGPVGTVPQPAAPVFAAALAAAAGWRDRSARAAPRDIADLSVLFASAPVAPRDGIAATTADPQGAPLDLTRDTGLDRMIDHIETLRDDMDARDTRIRLVPDALGGVDVAVRQEGDRVHVRFTTEQEATRALIADAQPRLTELAAARGVRIGETSIQTGAGSGASDTSSQFQNPSHSQQQPQRPAPLARATARPAPDRAAPDDRRLA